MYTLCLSAVRFLRYMCKTYASKGLERLHLLWFSVHAERQAKRMHSLVDVLRFVVRCCCCCKWRRRTHRPIQQVNYGQFTIIQKGICSIGVLTVHILRVFEHRREANVHVFVFIFISADSCNRSKRMFVCNS